MRLCLRCGAGFPSTGPQPREISADAVADWRCPACATEPAIVGGFPAFAPALAQGAAGFDPAHFAELARLEARNFWFRGRNRLVVWALRRYFPLARRFLEVGCGTGCVLESVARACPELEITASEAASEGLVHAARRVPRAALMQMDARRIPFRDEFDVAGAFDVIEHIEEDTVVLEALHAAVRPGGGILLTVPQHPSLWSAFDEHAGHVRRYRAAELAERTRRAGFEPVRMTSFVTLLLPLMFLSRIRPRPPGREYDPLADLRVSAPLNWLFERALDCERLLIRAGVPLPVGGSLLLVARRR